MELELEGEIVPCVNTLDDLRAELHKVFESDSVNVEYVGGLLSNYKSNPLEWKKFAHGDRYKYTRNLVDEGNGKFNLMLLVWGPSHTSTIHDHADAHCFMKMLDGTLQEVRFQWPDKEDIGMVETGRTMLKKNEVCYINDSLGLHRVENASHSEPAVSMHLYCPPFDNCQVFDEGTSRKMKCPVTFWSKHGKKVQTRNKN